VTGTQARRYAEEAAQARHGTVEFLAALLGAEVAQRDANVERGAHRPGQIPRAQRAQRLHIRTRASLNAPLVAELTRGAYITRREVILAVGPPGTGKTHTAIGLGLAACRQARRVRFTSVAELVTELSEAQAIAPAVQARRTARPHRPADL
jgi:DNA replication protein DnaC